MYCVHFCLVKVADEEIATNMRLFDHQGDEIPNANPLLAKFRYVSSKGLKRTWSQAERKELHSQANLKNWPKSRRPRLSWSAWVQVPLPSP